MDIVIIKNVYCEEYVNIDNVILNDGTDQKVLNRIMKDKITDVN